MLGVVHAAAQVATVSPARTGTGVLAITLPCHPPSTKCTVAAAAGAPAAQHVLERMRPGEVGERSGMHVDDAPRETVEERGREELHVAGADDETDPLTDQPVSHHASRERGPNSRRAGRPRSRPLLLRHGRAHGLRERSPRRPRPRDCVREAPAGSSLRRSRARRSRAHDPPHHELAARVRHDREVADPEVEDAPELLLGTWRASHSKTGGRSHALQSISAARPSGTIRARLPAMPPPVTWARPWTSTRSRRARTSPR